MAHAPIPPPIHGASPALLEAVGRAFCLPGSFEAGSVHGSGHINDTFVVTYGDRGAQRRYVLQRINDRIFKDVPDLMENVQRVTAHARLYLERTGAPDADRRSLRLIPTASGETLLRAEEGAFWRCYHFIERARTIDLVETPAQAREAAHAFGAFQAMLVDLPGKRLNEILPGFHDTRRRLLALEATIASDPLNRAGDCSREISFVAERRLMVEVLPRLIAKGDIPERITHNDTKINNVLMDESDDRALCVIDLDTVMPGLALYDFGDMIRSGVSPLEEDDPDTGSLQVQLPLYEALVEGYLGAAQGFLTRAEREHLAFAGRLITYEQGIRFLDDYLAGDRYYKTSRPGQNLDRARNQFALVKSLEEHEEAIEAIVRRRLSS